MSHISKMSSFPRKTLADYMPAPYRILPSLGGDIVVEDQVDANNLARSFHVVYYLRNVTTKSNDIAWAQAKRGLIHQLSHELHLQIPIIPDGDLLQSLHKKNLKSLHLEDAKVFPLSVRTVALVESRPDLVYGGKSPKLVCNKHQLKKYTEDTVNSIRNKITPSKASSRTDDVHIRIIVVEHRLPEHLELICV